jgi:organic radical activating enzyme
MQQLLKDYFKKMVTTWIKSLLKTMSNLAVNGIHIEPTNICTLKCSGCARTKFIERWPQHWKNHSIDIDQLMRFLDIDLQDKKIIVCGCYGDPIYHPEFIELIHRLKSRGAYVSITTNGSYKTTVWWQQLVSLLDNRDTVIFSVDGTPENFFQYRVNADWSSIHDGMQVVAQSPCHSVWKYIPFSYNQQDIDHTEELCDQIGIKTFLVEFSDRFDESNEYLRPDPKFLGKRFESQQRWRQDQNSNVLDPKCTSGQQHYITAEGFYNSCCWLADYRFYYKTIFGKNQNQFDIRSHTISEILQKPATIEFYNSLDLQPGCQFNCPKINS